MTRTDRQQGLKALQKDRSISRSGLDKSLPKKGAGQGNWGSVADEIKLGETEDYDEDELDDVVPNKDAATAKPPAMPRRQSSIDVEEKEKAKAFRSRALSRDQIDLTAIARTSGALSHSPPNSGSALSTSPVTSTITNKLGKY